MRKLAVVLLLAASPVLGQTATDRVATRIGSLVITVENQQDAINALQQQLQATQAELKALREKNEPKPADSPGSAPSK